MQVEVERVVAEEAVKKAVEKEAARLAKELEEKEATYMVHVIVQLQMEICCWQHSQKNVGTWDGMVGRNEVQSME